MVSEAYRRFLAIVMAAVVIAFAVAPVSGGEPSGLSATAPADERLHDELRFRRDFGLSTDIDGVRQLIADATADTSFGVALTAAEVREMNRRVAMESQMTPLEEAAEKLPGFAGHWIDQPAGGIIMVAFTGDASIHEVALRPLVPPGATMRLVSARYTEAELEALADEVFADRHVLEQSGVELSEVHLYLQTNQVMVGLRELTAASTALLQQRYGEAVSTKYSNPVPTGCTNPDTNCWGPPLRAGVSGSPDSWASGWCSIAFLVRHNSSGNRGWLTAGHCATQAGIGSVWVHASNPAWPMGTIMQTCWPQCDYSDSGRADICCFSLISNIVYDNNYPAGRVVDYAQGQDADDPGDFVCMNGRRSPTWRCGYLDHIGFWDYGGVWFWQQRFATYGNKIGDSGGAVHSAMYPPYNRVKAYGVQSGCTLISGDTCQISSGGFAIYSHIYHVDLDMGVTVCSVLNPCPQ